MPSQKSSKNSNPNERVFYTAGFDKVVTLPVDAVVQMPSKCQAKRLVLCTFFDPAKPHQSCPLKKKCNFVHADLRKAIQIQVVHVNYAWQSPTEVSYERFPEGMSLEVAPPGCKHIVDTMDSSLALKTKALGSTRLPLQHCAHYYYTRQCDLGSDCMFVHAVYVDPEAAPLQRAPVPRDMGRGREHLAAAPAAGAAAEVVPTVAVGVPEPKPAQQEELITVVGCESDEASMSRDSPAPQWFLASNRSSSDEELVPASSASDAGTMEAPRARSMSSSSNSSCGVDSPASASAPAAARPPVVAMRYRHDPYSIAGQRMIAVRAS